MTNKKKYFFNTLVLFTLFTCSSNFAMFQPLAKKIILWQEEKRKHKKNLKNIKQVTAMTAVDHEIDIIKNNIYKELLTELEFLTHKPYDRLKKYFDMERSIIKDLLQEKNPHIVQKHSEDIPSSIYKDLISILQENKVDPKNITLKYAINSDDSFLFAGAKGGTFNSQNYPYFKKPRIRIYSALTNLSRIGQLFTYVHELSHIFLRHSYMNSIVSYNYDINKLISIQEREADIHAATTNILFAHEGMEQACRFKHPDIFDGENHCREMQIMYELMKRKKELSDNQPA
jgi:hypothetical protein